MNEATIALTVMTFLIFVIILGFLIWGIKSGQFKDVEEAKYKMLEDDNEEHDVEEKEKGKNEVQKDKGELDKGGGQK